MADYNILNDRVYPGIVRIFGSAYAGTKYRVIYDSKESKPNEHIFVSKSNSETVAQNAGSTAKRFSLNIDFYTNKTNERDVRTDFDKISDVLERYEHASDASNNHQFFEGKIISDELPGEDDKWAFRINYDVIHHKVYS